ncbi:MAG: hypothetical protein UX98_C0020G0004 [Parcubacteria group bacterium GW2011_GWA2_47_26]|nr:MAG: hypothetical protein UX98_C0020G0004 [Parcubacteria group bacterium GW2011_GWA2_47_26]
MNWKKLLYFLVIIIVLIIVFITYKFFSTTRISNTSISGWFVGNQIWSGSVYITGDVDILGNLIKSYSTTHSSLFILGKLIAKGERANPIVFTSAEQNPNLADWEAIIFRGDGSIVDNIIVEYTRNGINPTGKQPNSVIQNTVSRHALWGAISSANSNIKIINNYLSDAGHEGIDLKFNGNQEVSGNIIDDCHTGIASIAGSQIIKNNIITNCGDGVYIDPKSSAACPAVAGHEIRRRNRYD